MSFKAVAGGPLKQRAESAKVIEFQALGTSNAQQVDATRLEPTIGGHDGQLLQHALRDQHSVERVAMV